ncbi:MAG: 2OG-Fe dioxygenase family protein [Cyanobacteria bacterium J06621_12]
MLSTKESAVAQNAAPEGILNGSVAVTMPLLDSEEASALLASCGELGVDPSSNYFTQRTKNIAYVLSINEQWFQLDAQCFIQAEQHNDFSGGYQRCYQKMPRQFLACEATKKVLNAFKSAYNIPDHELILVQVQKSHVTNENAGQCLTGQGIHSDGADRAMLVCLERNNVAGAKSAIYADLAGKRSLIKPFVLEEGKAMMWHDNHVYHHVQPAEVIESEKEGTRTVLIAHYPAIHYLQGTANSNNTLPTQIVDKSRRLRDKA